MSYTDAVERPFSGLRTGRLRRKALRGHRFNGFDWHTWGMQLRRYPGRKRTMKAIRLRRRTSTTAKGSHSE